MSLSSNPPTIEIIAQSAAKLAKRYRLEADDLTNEACSSLWESMEISHEHLEAHVRRTAERLRKQAQRRTRRFSSGADYRSVECRRPSEYVDIEDLKAFLRQVPSDGFERTALEVLLGDHPEFETIAEFAATNSWCSRNHAYRRIAALKRRIGRTLDATLN